MIWSREEVLDWLLQTGGEASRPCSASTSASPRPSRNAEPISRASPTSRTDAAILLGLCRRQIATTRISARRAFLEQVHRRHFYFGIADGVKADFMRFRHCDRELNAQGGRKSASAYDAIGAAQVAKASFAGMRLLHRLDGKVAIWPMDPLPRRRQRGGRNLHPHLSPQRGHERQEAPDPRRAQSGAGRPRQQARPACASSPTIIRPTLWSPPPECARSPPIPLLSRRPGLTPAIARTEGWTFGIL